MHSKWQTQRASRHTSRVTRHSHVLHTVVSKRIPSAGAEQQRHTLAGCSDALPLCIVRQAKKQQQQQQRIINIRMK